MADKRLTKAMILAAGFGTRLKPLTEKIPKALIPYKGKPMIENVINKLQGEGIEEFVINTHYLHKQVEEFFAGKTFGAKINLVYEPQIFGTGGGIKNARKYLEDAEDFLVYNADVESDMSIIQMYSYHLEKNPIVTLALKQRQSSRPLIVDENLNITGNKSPSGEFRYTIPNGREKYMGFTGVHIISSSIFEMIEETGFFDIFKLYFRIISSSEKASGKIIGFDIKNSDWKDLGNAN
jgi:NDP-sugar pyrophosphorylase family protein